MGGYAETLADKDDDEGDPIPSKTREYFQSEPPTARIFDPVYEQLLQAGELFHGHMVMESGYDQYAGQPPGRTKDGKALPRKGGWIACRGSSAPNRTERKVRRRVAILERPLHQLEEMDRREADRHEKKLSQMRSGKPLAVRPSIVNGVKAIKRDNTISRGDNLTTANFEKAVERVIQRENEKLRGEIIDAIAASTRFDPVSEAEAYLEEDAA